MVHPNPVLFSLEISPLIPAAVVQAPLQKWFPDFSASVFFNKSNFVSQDRAKIGVIKDRILDDLRKRDDLKNNSASMCGRCRKSKEC